MGLLTAQQGRERKEKKTRTLSTETTKSVQTFLRKLLCICLVHGFDLVYGTKLFCNFYQQRAHTNSKDTTALSKPFYVNRSKKTRQFFPALFSCNLEKWCCCTARKKLLLYTCCLYNKVLTTQMDYYDLETYSMKLCT